MDSKMMYMRCVIVILMGFLSSCQGYKFFVGGKDGWVVNPSENYNHWAARNRFQVNDTLFFKFNKGSDSVLVVNKDDYDKCTTTNPIQSLEDGDSEFKFDHSGPFFFISGNNGSCQKDQKLIIVVLAIRNTPHPAPTPLSPESPSLSPAPTPLSPSPESSPSLSPAPTPLSPSPESPSSSLSPAPTPLSPSPESSPSLSPAPTPLSPSPESSLSPAPTPLSPSPESSLSPESGSPSNSPADTNSTAPAPALNSSFSPAFTTSPVILVWGLSVVVSAIFGSFVGFI